jgi:hypothetical protein
MNKLLMIGTLVMSGSAFAGGYGDAGCGLGGMLIGSERGPLGVMQWFAVTLNGIAANQTFGITFGTLGCGGGGAAPTAEAFIDANRAALETEAAQGKGETLNSFATTVGCKDTAKFGTWMQHNSAKVFDKKNDSKAIAKSVKSAHCGA